MKFVLTKEFRFEAAHRLIRNYEGKCTNNHGHSFHVRLFLEGESLDDKDMLIDFHETDNLKIWIRDNFDHVNILWKGDPLIKPLQDYGNKVLITEKNPTSEHIAEIILKKAKELFNNSRVSVQAVEINETCTTGARVSG